MPKSESDASRVVGPLLVPGPNGRDGRRMLRVGGPPGLNMSLWVAAIALSAYVLHAVREHEAQLRLMVGPNQQCSERP